MLGLTGYGKERGFYSSVKNFLDSLRKLGLMRMTLK
jgi:hypothetical protein